MKSTQYNKLFSIIYSIILALVLFLILRTETHKPFISLMLIVYFLLFLSILLAYYKLTIIINDDYVAFNFGIGLVKKKYRLSSIRNCKPVMGKFSVYSRISFEKLPEGGRSYVLSSALSSVEITYEDENGIIKNDRIGTDEPYEITDYINKKIGSNYYPGR